jgi:hypothetical protein
MYWFYNGFVLEADKASSEGIVFKFKWSIRYAENKIKLVQIH